MGGKIYRRNLQTSQVLRAKHVGWPTNQEPSKQAKSQRDKPSQWVKNQRPKRTPPTTKNLGVEKTSRQIMTIPITCP